MFPDPLPHPSSILTPRPVLCFPNCSLFAFMLQGLLKLLFLHPCSPPLTVFAHSSCPRLFWSLSLPLESTVGGWLLYWPDPLLDRGMRHYPEAPRYVLSSPCWEGRWYLKHAATVTLEPQSRSGNVNKAHLWIRKLGPVTSRRSAFLRLFSTAHMNQKGFEAT